MLPFLPVISALSLLKPVLVTLSLLGTGFGIYRCSRDKEIRDIRGGYQEAFEIHEERKGLLEKAQKAKENKNLDEYIDVVEDM